MQLFSQLSFSFPNLTKAIVFFPSDVPLLELCLFLASVMSVRFPGPASTAAEDGT